MNSNRCGVVVVHRKPVSVNGEAGRGAEDGSAGCFEAPGRVNKSLSQTCGIHFFREIRPKKYGPSQLFFV
ncbi:hypothetical protein E2C01_018620 [Portunus trituberculatus]|uniref:Uncharacterized protein n=1 Tax=Portunus trituberculatus TaxID=210409 RepID=A0A5B7DX15_PORTR|nr:hypothetical protein [Portunus trituberculatus]